MGAEGAYRSCPQDIKDVMPALGYKSLTGGSNGHEANTSDDGHSGNKILSNQVRLSRLGLGKKKLKQGERGFPTPFPHFTLSQFLRGPTSRVQTIPAV